MFWLRNIINLEIPTFITLRQEDIKHHAIKSIYQQWFTILVTLRNGVNVNVAKKDGQISTNHAKNVILSSSDVM